MRKLQKADSALFFNLEKATSKPSTSVSDLKYIYIDLCLSLDLSQAESRFGAV